ncbi:MAG: YigZ family protein [Treponema sp.]|nr:MAG: YigZ family protein [Treponema sp.]
MKILIAYAKCELEIKRSRFLVEAFPVEEQSDARDLLKAQKRKYADATHVVHAFVLGKGAEILGCSDDGEPSGTAGKPALNVLKNSNVTNIFVSITRWFGGTLLGTGGLVKAYGDSVKRILEKASTGDLIETVEVEFSCSYADYEFLSRRFQEYSFEVMNTNFMEHVLVAGKLDANQKEEFAKFIFESTKGKTKLFTDSIRAE